MATYTRVNAWNNGGTFANTDLLWYAKGVAAMQARALDDPSSWWFFAAIHGEYVDTAGSRLGKSAISASGANDTATLRSVWDLYWDQCQHQSWYFLRGIAGICWRWKRKSGRPSSARVVLRHGRCRTGIISGQANQFNIPPAFTAPRLPDGSPNPLFVTARYGPDGDGNVFMPTLAAIQQHPNDPNFVYGAVTQRCMSSDLYTGTNFRTPPPGFGGPATGFSHDGGTVRQPRKQSAQHRCTFTSEAALPMARRTA